MHSILHPHRLPPGSVHLLRMDAAGHVDEDFWPWLLERVHMPA